MLSYVNGRKKKKNKKKKRLLNRHYYRNGNSGSTKHLVLPGLVICTSSTLPDQPCTIRGYFSATAVLHLEISNSNHSRKKIFRGIYRHPWQIANGHIHMVPHRSKSIIFFYTNIFCTELSCSSAVNND